MGEYELFTLGVAIAIVMIIGRGVANRLAVPDAIVLSAASPLDARLWPAARRVACIYGDTPLAFEGCADVLTGRAEPRGRFPLDAVENVAVR